MSTSITITRAIPDVRSTNVDKTVGFYTELLGFDVRTDPSGRVIAFASPTHAGVEVTLNRDDFSLPPGFTVEVDGIDAVRALHDRAAAHGVRVIEPPGDSEQLSVLDPSGRRVTIAAAPSQPLPAPSGDADRPITRTIPGVTTNDLDATRRFYVDYLGFTAPHTVDGVAFFQAPDSPAQLIGGTRASAPDGFDLDVGTVERVDRIHAAAKGAWMVLGEPADFPEHGIRCFTLFDPNGCSVNVAANLGT